MQLDFPQTLQEAVLYFSSIDNCRALMREIKWPDGILTCPCGAKGDDVGEIKTRHMVNCKKCRKQTSLTKGTVFESSKITLDHWMIVLWVVVNCKNGVSDYELGRAIGRPQKTAWFMRKRVQAALEEGGWEKFSGPAEADTTYVGGEARNMHKRKREQKIKGRGAVGKAIVHGILQRGSDDAASQVRCEVVGADDGAKLVPSVRRNVRFGAEVFTDSARAYSDLADTQIHRAIDHSVAYAEGVVHTNGLENFWCLLKRCLKGTHVAVAPFHLFRYVAEEAFRFNRRTLNDAGRFLLALRGIVGKRLTYRVLTAQDDAGFMGLS